MSKKKISWLFISCIEAQDSIFESGKMIFQRLQNSDEFSLDYVEVTADKHSVSSGYDFYLYKKKQEAMKN